MRHPCAALIHTGEERLQAHEVEVELAHGLVHHGRERWLGKVPLAWNRYAPRGCDLERAEVIQQVVIREALLHPAGALEKGSALNGGPEDATPSVPETRNLGSSLGIRSNTEKTSTKKTPKQC